MIVYRSFKLLIFMAAAAVISNSCLQTVEAQRRAPAHKAPYRAPIYKPPVSRAPSISIGPVKIKLPVAKPKAPAIKVFASPPRGHVAVRIGGLSYYRVGGVYYRPVVHQGRTVYVVSDPTLVVTKPATAPPELYEQVVVDGQIYYRKKLPTLPTDAVVISPSDPILPANVTSGLSGQPTVVPPPNVVGTKIRVLPASSKVFEYEGTTYHTANSTFYLPIGTRENPEFIVVPNPIR